MQVVRRLMSCADGEPPLRFSHANTCHVELAAGSRLREGIPVLIEDSRYGELLQGRLDSTDKIGKSKCMLVRVRCAQSVRYMVPVSKSTGCSNRSAPLLLTREVTSDILRSMHKIKTCSI